EAMDRARVAAVALEAAREAVAATLAAAKADALALPALRQAMRATAAFGISGAFPSPRRTGVPEDVLAAAASVVAEMDRRLAAAAAAEKTKDGEDARVVARRAQEAVQAVFGSGFVFVPSFRPAAPDDLARSLDASQTLIGHPSAVEQWLQQ